MSYLSYELENALPQELLDEITNKYETNKNKDVFEVNGLGRWGAGLDDSSYAPALIMNLHEYEDDILTLLREKDPRFQSVSFAKIKPFMHIWLPGSSINFHDDENPECPDRMSATFYITKEWNWNWGGLFLCDSPDQGNMWFYPFYNSCAWFRPPLWHAVSMVSKNAPHPRLSIQCFCDRID